MERVIKIMTRKEHEDEDVNFWSDKSFDEKLSAVQTLREQYIYLLGKEAEYNESRKRLRRVCRAVKQKNK